MSAARHTPGPWRVGVLASGHVRLDVPAGDELCVHVEAPAGPDGTLADAVLICGAMDGPTREANSRLIAAAPDLLEACEALAGLARECSACAGSGHEPTDDQSACRDCAGVGEIVHSAQCELGGLRAAIAKATGCAP